MSTRGRGRPREISIDEIRAVALSLFTAHGYDQTSLTQIAREAGISRTTLFVYFPTKRDIIWADHDLRSEALHEVLRTAAHDEIATEIMRALLTIGHYTVDEHEVLAQRYRITRTSPELRAYASLRVAELADEIVTWATAAPEHPHDRETVDRVTHALVAASGRIVDSWALATSVDQDLEPYLIERMAPFVAALAPLLGSDAR